MQPEMQRPTAQDLPAIVGQAWVEVLRRSNEADCSAAQGLRGWLAVQPNPHAAVLSGNPPTVVADDRSARELEALLLGCVAKNKFSRTTAAQHLYLMHRVGKRLRKLSVPLAPTWVSSILRPPPSPFRRDTARSVAKVEGWREAFNKIVTHRLPKDAVRLWALIAISAVCNGALLDRAKLTRLRLMIQRRELRIEGTAGQGHAFVEFLMPYAGLGNHHLQRWWCDPITELLLQQLPGDGHPCHFKATIKVLQTMLADAGVRADLLPKKMTDLLKSASIWWGLRCAPVDLHVMSRTLPSHSVTARCWTRLLGGVPGREPGAVTNPGRGESAIAAEEMDAEAELWMAATAEHEWLEEARQVLASTDMAGAVEWARAALANTPKDDYRYVYIGWLCAALASPSRNPKIGMRLKTLAEPFLLAAPRLLSHLGAEDPSKLAVSDLDETYRTVLDACEQNDPIERIARGLRLFHDHLVKAHKTQALPNPRATFGEGGALMPVDATVISIDEYLSALGWLEQQLQFGADANETHICQVVLILTFRCGLRRGEVFGLRLCDVQDLSGIYLHVRRYPGHRLKTHNATRTLRVDVLLTTRERALLRRWIDKRGAEQYRAQGVDCAQLRLLARPGSGRDTASIDGTVRRVMQAVHAVTKEPRLVLHHLRHSCATWLWLKLRAPDYPQISGYISTMPALRKELRHARRLRTQLCGAGQGPSRVYSDVVARTLGHGMPSTSLEHYIHAADLFLAATTLRSASTTPVEVWQALTGAGRSTVYAWLQSGSHGVVLGHRARLAPKGDPLPETQQNTTPWRKRLAAAPVRFVSDGTLSRVSRVLHLHNRLQGEASHPEQQAEVAHMCGVSALTVQCWLDSARALAPAFGMRAPRVVSGDNMKTVPAPDVDLHRPTVKALVDLTERFDIMAANHPELLRQALHIATPRFNLRRNDVCFRGEKDEKDARTFLKMMDIAGLVPERSRLTVRRVDPADTKLPHWFRAVRARELAVKRLPSPGTSSSQAKSYARWVGVQLCSPNGEAEGQAWRIGLFLASIAYSGAGEAI